MKYVIDPTELFDGSVVTSMADDVRFHRGYTNITMLFEFKGVSIGTGNPLWGAEPDKEYFVIKLGNRIQ